MIASTTQVYVYYRIRATDASAAIAAIHRFQAALCAALPGLVCSLSRRVDDPGDLQTVMETYSHASAAAGDWQAEVERQAAAQLGNWIVGVRHVEVFAPCA